MAISADISSGVEVIDLDTCDAIEIVQGRYWRVGTVNVFPAYRQEGAIMDASIDLNDNELYFYKSKGHDGWLVSSDVHEDAKTSKH